MLSRYAFSDLSPKRIVKAFEKAGFWMLKTASRKHIGMSNGRCKIIIPRHNRINPYTLKGIIRDAGLTNEEFKKLV